MYAGNLLEAVASEGNDQSWRVMRFANKLSQRCIHQLRSEPHGLKERNRGRNEKSSLENLVSFLEKMRNAIFQTNRLKTEKTTNGSYAGVQNLQTSVR